MWYGPFPTLYKNRLPAYYLEGATTWNTQANGRFFLFGFLRKYDQLSAYYDHPPLWSIPHLVLLNIIGGDLGHVTGCFSRLFFQAPKPRLRVVGSSLDALDRYAIKKHPGNTSTPCPTFGTGGISSRNPWRCLKAEFLVSTCFYRHGQRKRMKHSCVCLPLVQSYLSVECWRPFGHQYGAPHWNNRFTFHTAEIYLDHETIISSLAISRLSPPTHVFKRNWLH